jgi:hypothetical protein
MAPLRLEKKHEGEYDTVHYCSNIAASRIADSGSKLCESKHFHSFLWGKNSGLLPLPFAGVIYVTIFSKICKTYGLISNILCSTS